MAGFKKTWKSRKPYAKKTVAVAKKIVGKLHKAKAKKNMDTFFLKAKVQTTLAPSQGGATANYIYNHFPLMSIGASSVFDVTRIPEFNLYRVQYDKVRVNTIHIKITPKANVMDVVNAQNDADFNVTGDGMVHTVIDRDSTGPSNIARLERYPSYKAYSQRKGFSRSYSIKWPTGTWLDCQNIYGNDADTYLQRIGAFGGVTVYGENFVEDNYEVLNEPWAKVEISYNCVFQGKTSAGLSVDDLGRVILTPEGLISNLTFTAVGAGTVHPLQPSGGVKTFDESGNAVFITDIQ